MSKYLTQSSIYNRIHKALHASFRSWWRHQRENLIEKYWLIIASSYSSIVSITFPLSLLLFCHIFFTNLIIEPWNKRVLMESKNFIWFSFLYMEYVLGGIVSSLLRSASCNLLCFPWLSSCLHSPAPPPNLIFFNISSAPFPHYQHSLSLYVTQLEIKSHGGGRNKDDNEIRRKTGWARAWGRRRWWNVKWCSEGSFCSLSHQ